MYSGKKIGNIEYDERLLSYNLIRIEDYINSYTPLLHKCIFCGKEFKRKPKELNKIRCNCQKNKKSYLDKITSKNIELIGEYINMRKKIEHKCLNCKLVFLSTPKNILNSVIGCPSCSGKKFSTEKYKQLLPNNIHLLDDIYDGSNKYLKHQCDICKNIWETKPNYILHMNCGCPYCSSSKGEIKISNLLNELGIKFEKEKIIKIDNTNYRFDFFISEMNLFIEYDGIQHFEPIKYFGGDNQFDIIKSNDMIKNNWISQNNFHLIRIPYYIKDIELDLSIKLIEFIDKSI